MFLPTTESIHHSAAVLNLSSLSDAQIDQSKLAAPPPSPEPLQEKKTHLFRVRHKPKARQPIKEWGKKLSYGIDYKKVVKNMREKHRIRLEEKRCENFGKAFPQYCKHRVVQEDPKKKQEEMEQKQRNQIQQNQTAKLNILNDFSENFEKLALQAEPVKDKISTIFQSLPKYENVKDMLLENVEKSLQSALTQLEKIPAVPSLSFSSIEKEFQTTCNKIIEAATLQFKANQLSTIAT